MSNALATTIRKSEVSFNKKVSGNMTFDKEAHFAMQLLSKNNFSVTTAQKNPDSLMSSMINVAAIGLSLNPANADAYLVPRDGAICLDVSYKGLIKLATNTGSIKWVQAEIVYDADEFKFKGVGKKPKHESNPFGDRGSPIGVYCIAKTVDGDFLVTIMDGDEIEAVRNTSKAKDSDYSPWKTFPMEMWKKTVIKRAAKTWPKTDLNGSDHLSHAIEVINEHEGLEAAYGAVSDEATDYYAQLVEDENCFRLYRFFTELELEQQVSVENDYVSAHAAPRGKGTLKTRIKMLKASGREEALAALEAFNDEDESIREEALSLYDDSDIAFINTLEK